MSMLWVFNFYWVVKWKNEVQVFTQIIYLSLSLEVLQLTVDNLGIQEPNSEYDTCLKRYNQILFRDFLIIYSKNNLELSVSITLK